MTLASKGYVATTSDVADLTKEVLSAVQSAEGGRLTYLRSLVATTIDALGAKPRLHARKVATLDADGIKTQMSALDSVHERFYSTVIDSAKALIPPGKDHAIELNRKTNFARTAVYAIRRWIKAGNDLTAVVPSKVTKTLLGVKGDQLPTRPPTPARMQARVARHAKELLNMLTIWVETDKIAAVAEMDALLERLASERDRLIEQKVQRHRRRAKKMDGVHAMQVGA